jgi:peptidoglycan/xylan/chitin deacetylase (PgdA/CDA1 family)
VALMNNLAARALGRYQRTTANLAFRRPLAIETDAPIISFTFDDFPRSAFSAGGRILEQYGVAGTYYASFGLMGAPAKSATAEMFVLDDATTLLSRGHELGCHTYAHSDSWKTETSAFAQSLAENREALTRLIPGASFTSFSYPINVPRMLTKREAGRRFLGCRCGGQGFNSGVTDLNLLAAYFLEKTRDHPDHALRMIVENQRARGWLIFATHDVSDRPTPYGCRPALFERIVKAAVHSGARVLTVAKALQLLWAAPSQ